MSLRSLKVGCLYYTVARQRKLLYNNSMLTVILLLKIIYKFLIEMMMTTAALSKRSTVCDKMLPLLVDALASFKVDEKLTFGK